MSYLSFSVLALFFLALVTSAKTQEHQVTAKQLMTPQEFKDAGLHKLTPDELQVLNAWITRHTLNVARRVKARMEEGGGAGTRSGGKRGYLVQKAIDGETFIINDNVYKAQTLCMDLDEGDEVLFVEGSPLGACASAKLVNLSGGDVCEVWCE